MSDKKPADPAAKGAAPAAVIRLTESAEESAQERLMKKHVPAWVVSGAVHVGLIAVLILMFGTRGTSAKPDPKPIDTTAAKQDDPPDQSLVNEDAGLQSNLEAALPELERVAEKTVEAVVTKDNLGQPDAPETDPQTALAVPGLAADLTTPGVAGVDGSVLEGKGGGGGHTFASFPGRSGATKSKLLAAGGGNAASEAAVARGLAYLARQQKPDGSWVFDGNERGKDHVVAATGMCLLPFLAAGETHRAGQKYQSTVARGLAWLLKHCPVTGPDAGRMSPNMYAQGIATIALCEAYGMTKDKGLLLAGAQAAVNHVQKAQGPNGSWGYGAGANGDTSIVGWQIQALKAAQLSKDLVVDAKVIKKAIEFLDHVSKGSRKAEYGYANNAGARPATSLTAVGLLCRYYIDGWGPDNGGMQEGVLGLMKRAPTGKGKPDMYYYYYATQVVHFFEGDEWKAWNEGAKGADGVRKGGMRDWLVDLQVKKAGPNEGSWEPDGGHIGGSCGRLGTTALSVLTLEVYYRHLPLYKRSNAGDGAVKILEGAK